MQRNGTDDQMATVIPGVGRNQLESCGKGESKQMYLKGIEAYVEEKLGELSKESLKREHDTEKREEKVLIDYRLM